MTDFLKNWGALAVAILALIQPWLIAGWRRLFRAGAVDIHETGSIEIGYSTFGTTVGLLGTLRARDRDLFIRAAQLEVIREADGARHAFQWGLFRSYKFIVGKAEEIGVELPSGFMLLTSQPYRYNVQFHDLSLLEANRAILQRVQQAWFQALMPPGATEPNADPQALYPTFARQPQQAEAWDRLRRACYWNEGRYRLVLTIDTVRPDRPFRKTWQFTLTAEDAERLRLNVVKILEDTCVQRSATQYYFAHARYEE